jgi:hypothetical protein
MQTKMKQGRLPLGLPRVARPRSATVFAAFHRPAAVRAQQHGRPVVEGTESREDNHAVVVLPR